MESDSDCPRGDWKYRRDRSQATRAVADVNKERLQRVCSAKTRAVDERRYPGARGSSVQVMHAHLLYVALLCDTILMSLVTDPS